MYTVTRIFHRAFHKLTPSTPSHSLVKLVLVVKLGLLVLGCAHGNFNKLTYDRAKALKVYQARRIWSGPCYEARVKRAKAILLDGRGSPYVALYYLRCVEKPRNDQTIKPRRSK